MKGSQKQMKKLNYFNNNTLNNNKNWNSQYNLSTKNTKGNNNKKISYNNAKNAITK